MHSNEVTVPLFFFVLFISLVTPYRNHLMRWWGEYSSYFAKISWVVIRATPISSFRCVAAFEDLGLKSLQLYFFLQ